MMRLRMLTILLLGLVLVASSALADKSVTVKRLGDPLVNELSLGVASRADCQVGNLNAVSWAIGDWVFGLEGYKYLFDPTASCGCAPGFHLEAVHLLMQFGAEDVPVTFDAYVDLEEAAWDGGSGCWIPGPEICVSPVIPVTIDTPGLYDISIPIYDQCPCASRRYMYLLSFPLVSSFPTNGRPDLLADDTPLVARAGTISEPAGRTS